MRRVALAWLLPLLLPWGAVALQEEVRVGLGQLAGQVPSAARALDVLEDSRGADDFLPPADSVGDDLVGPEGLARFGGGPRGLAEFGAGSGLAAPAAPSSPAAGAGAGAGAAATAASPPAGAGAGASDAASAPEGAPPAATAGASAAPAPDDASAQPAAQGDLRAAGAAAELLAPAKRDSLAQARPDAPLDANSTWDRQHALREVARARATRVKDARGSSRSLLVPYGGIDRHLNAVVVLVLTLCMTLALALYAIGVESARDCGSLLFAAPKVPSSEHSPSSRAAHRQLAIRAGISPLRSSLAPPWPQRQQKGGRRVGFDPMTAGLPSAESLESVVGTLNAAPPSGAVFPPPQRWAASPARTLGPPADAFAARLSVPACSDSEDVAGAGLGVTATLSGASAAAWVDRAYSLGSFGGTWGKLEQRQGAAAAA